MSKRSSQIRTTLIGVTERDLEELKRQENGLCLSEIVSKALLELLKKSKQRAEGRYDGIVKG